MQLKKILLSVLVAIMMFSLVALVATAADKAPEIDVVAETSSAATMGGHNIVKPGTTFTYIVKVDNNPGINIFQATVAYNSSLIEWVGYEIGDVFDPSILLFKDQRDTENPEADKLIDLSTQDVITDDIDNDIFIGLAPNTISFAVKDEVEVTENGAVVAFKFKVKDECHDIEDILVKNVYALKGVDSAVKVYANVANSPVIKVHSYGDPALTPATCTEAGKVTYVCADCNDTIVYDDPANPAKGHTEASEFTTKVPATCTETGTKVKLCTECGAELVTEVIPANGHNLPDTWTQTVAPTVDAQGEEERKCTECDFKETRPVAKLPKFITKSDEWILGSEEAGITFVTDAAYDDFISVSIDGKDLARGSYTLTNEGGTKVVLKAEYLDTLAEGEHKIAINSANGVAETTFNVVEESSPAVLIICIVVAVVLVGVVATVVVLKKKELI